MQSENAKMKVKTRTSPFSLDEFTHIYKKIDSTLRGNIGSEIEALFEIFSFEIALVVPSYPENGRTVIEGNLFVHNIPLDKTEIASDPKSPIRESNVLRLVANQTNYKIGHVELATIEKGEESIVKKIRSLRENQVKIIVCDASTKEHMMEISRAGKRFSNILWVGSAGLAYYYSKVFSIGFDGEGAQIQAAHKVLQNKESSVFKEKTPPCLIVAGSMTNTTKRQVEELLKNNQVEPLKVNPLQLFDGAPKLTIADAVEQGKRHLNNNKHVVIVLDSSPESQHQFNLWKKKSGFSNIEIGNSIANFLGVIVEGIISDSRISGLVLTGGDIAVATCSALETSAISILDEVEEGIPLGKLLGGKGDHIYVVTKAGAFGSKQSFAIAVDRIQQSYNNMINGVVQYE